MKVFVVRIGSCVENVFRTIEECLSFLTDRLQMNLPVADRNELERGSTIYYDFGVGEEEVEIVEFAI